MKAGIESEGRSVNRYFDRGLPTRQVLPTSGPHDTSQYVSCSTLHQSSHGLATQTKALAREIPPATQAIRMLKFSLV